MRKGEGQEAYSIVFVGRMVRMWRRGEMSVKMSCSGLFLILLSELESCDSWGPTLRIQFWCRAATMDILEESQKSLPRQRGSYFYHFPEYCRLEEEGSSRLWGKTKVQRREMAGSDVLGVDWIQGHG